MHANVGRCHTDEQNFHTKNFLQLYQNIKYEDGENNGDDDLEIRAADRVVAAFQTEDGSCQLTLCKGRLLHFL